MEIFPCLGAVHFWSMWVSTFPLGNENLTTYIPTASLHMFTQLTAVSLELRLRGRAEEAPSILSHLVGRWTTRKPQPQMNDLLKVNRVGPGTTALPPDPVQIFARPHAQGCVTLSLGPRYLCLCGPLHHKKIYILKIILYDCNGIKTNKIPAGFIILYSFLCSFFLLI